MGNLAMEYVVSDCADRLPVVLARSFNHTGPCQIINFVTFKLLRDFARRLPVVKLSNSQVKHEFNDIKMVSEDYLQLLQYAKLAEVYNIFQPKLTRLSMSLTCSSVL